MAVRTQLKAYADAVDRRLESLLDAALQEPPELIAAMRYSALAPGKRIRPGLVLACAEAVGGRIEQALDGACAVELVHCFSLIHDDLPALDDDAMRRGRPTCHVQFGEAVAILAGDALFGLAFDTLASCPQAPDRVVRAVQVLTRATALLVSGETTDILAEGKPIDAETLQRIHERKTGALVAASCELGAILGGGSDSHAQALARYGSAIGLAFQIADDLLNETASPEQLGKSAGSDRERGKATYPALYGIEASRAAAREAVDRGLRELEGIENAQFLRDLAQYAIEREV